MPLHDRITLLRRLPVLMAALTPLGCSSEPANVVPDAAVVDAPPPADAGAPVDVPGDAATSVDAGTCADFSGGYALSATCSEASSTLGGALCIAQSGCTATVSLLGDSQAVVVNGDSLTFSLRLQDLSVGRCTATIGAGGTVALQCSAGSITCMGTGARMTSPLASRFCCDVSAQDCGGGRRCALLGQPATPLSIVSACLPVGSAMLGDACAPRGGVVGDDDCGSGLHCTAIGQRPGARTCARLCRQNTDCATGELCFPTASANRAGICRPGCTLASRGCAAGSSCRSEIQNGIPGSFGARVLVCTPDGPGAAGASCAMATDCGPDLQCAGVTPTCVPVCGMDRACAAGSVCARIAGNNPLNHGVCVAAM